MWGSICEVSPSALALLSCLVRGKKAMLTVLVHDVTYHESMEHAELVGAWERALAATRNQLQALHA